MAVKGFPNGKLIVERVRTPADVEAHNRTKYVRDVYRVTNTPSKIFDVIVQLLKTEFYIPECFDVKKPKEEERIYWQFEDGWVAMLRHLLFFSL